MIFIHFQVFIFSTSDKNWRHYDWDKVTTVAAFSNQGDDLLCFARQRGARVVAKGCTTYI